MSLPPGANPPPPSPELQPPGSTLPPSAEPFPPPGATIVASGVTKSFAGMAAVSDVTLAISPGVTALLGPNGAGKSTLLRLLTGLIPPTAGQVTINGGNPRHDSATRKNLGLVPQQDGVFEREKAYDTVYLAAVLSQVAYPRRASLQALKTVELESDLDRPVGAFSKGVRQRLKIAQAIVHDPAIIFLDEPLNGLDPKQRRQMIEVFHRLGSAGKTVLVSSHVLEEVERFGSQVVVMSKGRLAAQGDFQAIRKLMDNQPLRFRITCTEARRVAALLLVAKAVTGCTIQSDEQFEVTTHEAAQFRQAITATCAQLDSRLREFLPLDDDLESVFRYLVGA